MMLVCPRAVDLHVTRPAQNQVGYAVQPNLCAVGQIAIAWRICHSETAESEALRLIPPSGMSTKLTTQHDAAVWWLNGYIWGLQHACQQQVIYVTPCIDMDMSDMASLSSEYGSQGPTAVNAGPLGGSAAGSLHGRPLPLLIR